MAAYDPWQTTFALSMLANAASGPSISVHVGWAINLQPLLAKATAAAQAQLTQTLNEAVATQLTNFNTANPPTLGASDWKVVWGPQVFVVGPVKGSYDIITGNAKFNATNAMAAFYSQTLGRYVVAIAATNPSSWYDWLTEDFDTNNVVAWDGALQVWNGKTNTITPSAQIPCLSQGTFIGISNLLGMVDTVTTNKTLIGWLTSFNPASGDTLTFCGHSLAGALSPTLTAACFDSSAGLLTGTEWKAANAMIYPTAGATPGNGPFATLVAGLGLGGTNGSQPWQLWNQDLHNNLDIVPRAWDPASMQALPQIYSAYYDKVTIDLLNALVNKAIAHAAAGVAVAGPYAAINPAYLNGTSAADAANEFVYDYQVTIEGQKQTEELTIPEADASPYSPTKQTTVSWTTQLLFQHTTAYGRIILGKSPEPVK